MLSTPTKPVHPRCGLSRWASAPKISTKPLITQKMPSSRASATTETRTWRIAYSPTTRASSPSTAFSTRTPPLRSLPANAPTNWNNPTTTSWMPNRMAMAMTVGPGHATAATPAISVRMPKDSSQIQWRPIRATRSATSVRGSGLIRGSSDSQ